MNIVYPPGARNNNFDRNAVTKNFNYFNWPIPPHALTVRWSYTVPAAKKFSVGGVSLSVAGFLATTAAGAIFSSIRYTPSGGAATHALDCAAGWLPNGSNNNVAGMQGFIASTGDFFEGITADTTTTTQTIYGNDMVGFEFDA